MSYGQVKSPRIYVDWINWLLSSGKMQASDITADMGNETFVSGSSLHGMFDLDPSNLQNINVATSGDQDFSIKIDTNLTTDANQACNFVAILGHNLKQIDAFVQIQSSDTNSFNNCTISNIANTGNIVGNLSQPAFNGWSIYKIDNFSNLGNQKINIKFISDSNGFDTSVARIGCIMLGKYFDFNTPPDLKFNRQDVFNNKIQSALTGKSYSHLMAKPNKSWFLDRWEMSTSTSSGNITTSSKKIVSMNFSFMFDEKVFPESYSLEHLTTSDNFYASVLNKSLGSHFPVILQFDKSKTYTTASTPNDIMLARIHNTKINQTAVNHYSVSLVFEEQL